MSNTDRIDWKSIFSLSSMMYTILGVFSALVALQGFMIPNHFLDGGITGISILVEEVFHIPFSVCLILFNLPFILIGYKKIGKTFSVNAFLAVILLAVLMTFISFPQITSDKVLIAVFGGFFIGLGIGLVIRGGGVIDGLEIIAHYTNKRIGFSTGEIIMTFNTLLFIGAAFEFGLETAMYSILVYFTAMKTSDYVVDGFEEFTALTIISKEFETVKSVIVNDFGKAITVYKGERGYLPSSFEIKQDCDIVMTIVTRIEIHRIKEVIKELDPNAFFYVQRIKEVKGGLGKHNTKQH
ncbi:YitT family protein [Gillisia sp. Q332]|uniref:YitT family protein n=1 Tax=Gillisia xinjiangensis TaxID=3384765 RepID=UPI00391D0B4B